MENKRNKIEKNWNQLTTEQKDITSEIFKRTLLNCYLIPSKTETKSIYSFLEENKPSVSLTLENDIETVQNVNEYYLKVVIQKMQISFFKENNYGVHEEYIVKTPEVVGLDKIFESLNL